MTFEASAEVYARHVGRYGPALSAALIDAVGVNPGDRCLDVGCGPGVLTAALAERAGAQRVVGIDPSESFVAACRERVPGADIHIASAESLPFEDGEFDVALAQLVVNYMRDPDLGVAEMKRVVRGGGMVGGCIWDYSDGMTMLRAFWDAALELDPEAPDQGRTTRFCREDELGELWERCGLRDVESGALLVSAAYEDFDDYWSPFPTGVAPSGDYCASLGPERRQQLQGACFRRLGSPAGQFTLHARAWYARGRA
jgi:SAM-dependent methyltransferase